jgi:hypothetical protein
MDATITYSSCDNIAFKTSMQQVKENAKELSRIGVNAVRSFEQTSREPSRLS